jgi:hypothetical protein
MQFVRCEQEPILNGLKFCCRPCAPQRTLVTNQEVQTAFGSVMPVESYELCAPA